MLALKNRITNAEATVAQKMNIAARQEQPVPIKSGGCIRSCLDFFVTFFVKKKSK